MTEHNEIESLKAEIEELKSLISQKPKSEDALERIAAYLDKQEKKPKPTKWHNKELIEFPDGKRHYVTEGQKMAKETVDKLIKAKRLSINASEATLNKFLGNAKIRDLPRSLSFWAKQYYKNHYLVYPKKEVKRIE